MAIGLGAHILGAARTFLEATALSWRRHLATSRSELPSPSRPGTRARRRWKKRRAAGYKAR